MSDSVVQVKERLSQIDTESKTLLSGTEAATEEMKNLLDKLVQLARQNRADRGKLANLKAEAALLCIEHELDSGCKEFDVPPVEFDLWSRSWAELKSVLQPARADAEWLDKIHEAERGRATGPVLSEADRAELEARLKDNVCPMCVSFSLDGSCTVQSFEQCPITTYLDQLVSMIESLGHRPWMEDYFERMYREICPGCKGRVDKDYCPPREEGECSLFTYLPTIIRTVEGFMKERAAAEAAKRDQ